MDRADALVATCALAANADHGMRRSTKDKLRCIEIAVKEFPKLSSRAIAEMVGVNHETVEGCRPLAETANATRTTKDGRQYPAHRKEAPKPEPATTPDEFQMTECEKQELRRIFTTPDYATEKPSAPPEPHHPKPVLGPPRDGMQFARIAVMNLEEIRENDAERAQAFAHVKGWLMNHGA